MHALRRAPGPHLGHAQLLRREVKVGGVVRRVQNARRQIGWGRKVDGGNREQPVLDVWRRRRVEREQRAESHLVAKLACERAGLDRLAPLLAR